MGSSLREFYVLPNEEVISMTYYDEIRILQYGEQIRKYKKLAQQALELKDLDRMKECIRRYNRALRLYNQARKGSA